MIVLKAHSDGWRLLGDAFPEPEDRGWPYRQRTGALPRLVLEGLRVTTEEATAISAARPPHSYWSGDWRGATGPWPLTLEVTLEEAMAIWRGADPMGVLFPKYRARALTEKELLA